MLALEQSGTLLCPVRPAAKLVEAPDVEESFLSHDAGLRSMRWTIVKNNVTHERNTCRQQFPSVSSICTRSGISRSAAAATTVSEVRHVRARINSSAMQETTCFLDRGTGDARAKPMLDVLDALSGAVFSAMVTKAEDEYAVAVVAEAWPCTGRARVILLSDQEKPTK